MLRSGSRLPSPPEALLRLLFDQAPGFMAVLEGPEHRFKLVNPAYERLIGGREVVDRPVAEALPETGAQGFVAVLDRVFASGQPYVGRRVPVLLQRGEDGAAEQRYLDFVYQPVLDTAGRTLGIFVEGNDVTEHIESEQRARLESDRRDAQRRVFETVLSSIEDFAYVFDREHRFTYANKPLLDLLGLRLDELVGRTFLELPYPAELAQRLDAQVGEVLETRAQVRGETFYESPTGHKGWFEYIFNPVPDADGAVNTVVGSTRNVSARAEAEARLAVLSESERAARAEVERAARLKDEFLATLSHELRTPLNAILGWSELLRSGRLEGEAIVEAAERIVRSARTQAQLIADLLDMNGVMSGKVRLEIQRVPLSRPLDAAIDAVKMDALKKKVALHAPAPAPAFLVDGDPGRLQQVFWNLLSNAVKFTPAGGTVRVEVASDPAEAEVRVIDTGIGMQAEFLPRMFQRFSQADSSTTRRHGGLGLGLSITKSLVEMHGGRIEAHSDGPNRGSTFTVHLPLRQEHLGDRPVSAWGVLGEKTLPSGDEALALRGARILVVDDDEEGLEVVGSVLRQYGAIVAPARSAHDALAELARQAPRLVLCDIGLPHVDGYELLRRIRQVSQVPAIALTAFARDEDCQRALESGFVAYLAKPAEPGRIVATCARVIGAASAAR
ncbi:MAG TPA: ATP-binding protein [Caldimonas sp.]|nr:ATP-binding protein [Caldimonas sp.]HEX2539995.1 ATP-binding protein [Caldimonas sp.]